MSLSVINTRENIVAKLPSLSVTVDICSKYVTMQLRLKTLFDLLIFETQWNNGTLIIMIILLCSHVRE